MSHDELHVGRSRVAYRIPRHLAGEKGRLDRALGSEVRASRLDLSGCGIGPEELVCIRALSTSPTRVRAGECERVLTERWLQGVELAIRDALSRDDPAVVRYRSRRHALTDLVLRAARGDDSRTWVFTELGYWSAGSEPRAAALIERALGVLASQPPAIVPVLVAAAEQHALAALISGGSPAVWGELTQLALRAGGFRGRALSSASTILERRAALGHGFQRVAPALERCALIRALALMPSGALSEPKRRALAVLCALSVEPFSNGEEVRLEAAIELARELAFRSERAVSAPEVAKAPDVEAERSARDVPGHEASSSGDAAPSVEADAAGAKVANRQAVTRAGGLLFLVHLLCERGLYAALQAEPALTRFPLRALLHRLALRLAPLSPDDPAALAFAGLAPGAEPPDTADFTTEETAALERYVTLVIEALVERLAGIVAFEPEELLAWVIARRARVFADPGWLELRFLLDDVSTELRRVALDLHPNWLPALGVVLRFTYE